METHNQPFCLLKFILGIDKCFIFKLSALRRKNG